MKNFSLILSFFIVFTLQAEQSPHLILHFDINKTLIASDKTENKTIEHVINELLSRKYSACWDETVQEPMTFDAYVKRVLLPGPDHDVKLKEERLAYLIHFIDYLKEDQHPLYPKVLEECRLVLNTLEKAQGNIFPSFYRLISELSQKEISYTLFLRSFGKEVFEVKDEINSVCKDLFKIEGIFQKGVLYLEGKEILNESQTIYDFFCSKQNAAIRDDWHYWMQGEMEARYGKPLYIDQENRKILPLFFDDNIKTDFCTKNVISPIDFKTGELIPVTQLLESKQAVSVNTLEAILDEGYYIHHVQEALRIHKNRSTTPQLSSEVNSL